MHNHFGEHTPCHPILPVPVFPVLSAILGHGHIAGRSRAVRGAPLGGPVAVNLVRHVTATTRRSLNSVRMERNTFMQHRHSVSACLVFQRGAGGLLDRSPGGAGPGAGEAGRRKMDKAAREVEQAHPYVRAYVRR